jgi:hypothetical protein
MTSSFQLADCRSLLVDACHTVVYDLVSPVIRSSGHMNLDAVAKRISDISRSHLPVLDCLAEGMSNSQIAVKLGYKNQKTVATIIYDLIEMRHGAGALLSGGQIARPQFDLVDDSLFPAEPCFAPKYGRRRSRAAVAALARRHLEKVCRNPGIRPRHSGIELLAEMLAQRVGVDANHPTDIRLGDAVADHRLDGAALLLRRAETPPASGQPFLIEPKCGHRLLPRLLAGDISLLFEDHPSRRGADELLSNAERFTGRESGCAALDRDPQIVANADWKVKHRVPLLINVVLT